MTQPGTLELVGQELALIFAPLEARFAVDNAATMFAELGLMPPDDLAAAPALVSALGQAVSSVVALPSLIAQLADAIEAENAGAIASAGIALLQKIADAVQRIGAVAQAIDGLATSLAGLTAAQRDELRGFAGAFVERMLERLFVEYIQRRSNAVFVVLLGFGAIEFVDVPAGPPSSLAAPYQRKQLHIDRALKLFRDPLGLLQDVYHWGAGTFDGIALFRMMQVLLDSALGLSGELLRPSGLPATLEAIAFSATVDPAGGPGLEISLRPAASASSTQTITDGAWTVSTTMSAQMPADLDFTLRPPLDVRLQTPSATVDAALVFDVHRAASAPPLVLFGKAGGSRLEAKDLTAGTAFTGHWTSGGGPVSLIPGLRAGVAGGKLVITGAGGDSLISQVLRGVDLEALFDLGLSWSPSKGLVFTGSAGLAIDIPTHARLGPITVDDVFLGFGIATQDLHIDLAVTIGAELGPLTAKVNRMGLRAVITFPPGGGNLGPAQLDFAFKPPTGVGVSLDTPTVKLAGFLDIDEEAHQYAGAVEIRIVDTFELSAIGIINTRFPDGSAGFSLLFIIDTVFPTPILLGYNFYLAAVGGMLGLHRTIDLDRLRDGLRDGAASNILFPKDVVANMTAIVSQLQAIFPPKRDQFIVGPMARITWNTPPLITIELGLIIEFAHPVRIAILGLLRAAVPDQDDPIVDIKVAFLGAIDFDRGLLSFDASIYDSYIGRGSFKFSFEGDIAIRLSWGKNKDFLSSVGGFHPSYHAPAYLQVPAMRRITLSLLKDNPRLKLTSYFALTTNTIQFGAELDFYFGIAGFSVVGNFGFDVLFGWNPFRFIASVHARLAVRMGDTDLLSLSLAFELQGTTPWKAKGTASFGILFWTISVHFEKTWGEQRDLNLPTVAVLPAVLDEFRRDVNWKTGPVRATPLVQLFPSAQPAGALRIDAAGVVEVSQSLVPLGAELALFNNAKPSDISSVDIHEVRIGGVAVPPAQLAPVTGEFAPAAFRELADKDKLAARSYEPMRAGTSAVGSDALTTDYLLGRPVTYENIVDDGTPNAPPVRSRALGRAALFVPLVRGGAVGASALSKRAAVERQRASVRDVTAGEERFTVVSTADLRAVDAASHGLSRSQAQDRLGKLIAAGASPDDVDIVPAYRAAS